MQADQKYSELEEEAREEFSKHIIGKDGNKKDTIDSVSIIEKDGNLRAEIKLKNDNKDEHIKISEFLNNDFCREKKITGFAISNGEEEIISGRVDSKGVRHYDLGKTTQYEIKFNWYVDERKCSIILSVNSNGSIEIVGGDPADEDLKKNEDVRIKVGDNYLSLADAVKTCKASSKLGQQKSNENLNKVSSKLDQPSVSPHSAVNQRDEQLKAAN